jgi:hypothetical protein
MSQDANEATGFQFGLVEALGGAQAWLLTDEQITELQDLTHGGEKENVRNWHWSSPVALTISGSKENLFFDFTGRYCTTDIASMKNKLAQYPSRTKFVVRILTSSEDAAPVLKAINEVANERGLDVAQVGPAN